MTSTRLVVVKLSDSFERLWHELAQAFGVESLTVANGDAVAIPPDAAAILVAAGSAETDVPDWLDRHGFSRSVPIFAVGTDPGRRLAMQIVRRGATDYFALPDDAEILRNAVGAAVERSRQREATGSSPAVGPLGVIIGESPALKHVLSRAARILPHADSTVLIVGEAGTGKELLARAIHKGGPRRGAPFVTVNCSALPDRLIESELFGHERGAFTEVRAAKPGLFEVADGGTLFLDEIGQLPVELQPKLLRVLQEKRIRRVGGTRTHDVNVRIVAATNEDLSRASGNGGFRHDLYCRLGVITLALPPLRDRGEDILLIAQALLARLAERFGLPVPPVNADVRRELLTYHWPGNVRELRNGLERALLMSPPGELRARELQASVTAEVPGDGPIPFPAHLEEITVAAARATVALTGGNRTQAARRLGISRGRLRRLLDAESPTL